MEFNESQDLKNLKVAFHHATKDDVIIHNIRLPKQSTVGDVINELKTKVELSHPNAELRLLEVFYHKIYKIFPPSEKIENINDQYWTLRAEEIPEEEKNLGPHDRLIHVYHFTKETVQNQMQVQNFGEPFFLIIHEGETLAEVKERIQKKLQVPDEEFSKWKFAFLSLGRPEYLQDSHIVSSRFQTRDVYGAWEQYLGLEHSDTAPKRAYAANQVVHFRALERPKEDDFCLELSKLHNYDDVVERVARRLGLDDPSKIRLTSHNCYSQQPKPQPIKYRGVEHLSDMLVHYNQSSDILYYEVLDIPLPELQGWKNLKVAFHHATKDDVIIHNIRLPKQSTVGDVINELKTKVELSHPNAELRLLEVFSHKIYKIFPPSEKIENINDQYWTLRAEEIPEEEKNLGPHDRLIHVYHFTKETVQNQMQVQNFGEPFFLIIHEGETLAEVKERIQKKLQVPDEEFSKWKFAFLSLGRPEYLQDSHIVSSRFQTRDVYGAWEQYLGLEHSDTAPKRAYAANQCSKTDGTQSNRLLKRE
ncbi:ubiquitin carboxyl-terminal hydrolase 12-like isoform X2 [Vitis riparia]|uniref:ubiquitin carboxyl-terminal hydrolase 12-like isoform X2 n=1 Tax=Vitis riparia TaxID=96939 RepID=UPI00155A8BD2|nr:ubiquitin carboxyl-terminal hydrolase 12-like isoform X2 [Vitis riparia]